MRPVTLRSSFTAHLFLSAFFSLFVFFTARDNESDGNIAGLSASGKVQGSGGADTSFSATIDGKVFSSTGTDQHSNAAFRLKAGEKHIFFKLADMNDPSQRLNFEVPAKQGSTTYGLAMGYNGYK